MHQASDGYTEPVGRCGRRRRDQQPFDDAKQALTATGDRNNFTAEGGDGNKGLRSDRRSSRIWASRLLTKWTASQFSGFTRREVP